MAHVDGYIFPCYSCGNPAGQMDATLTSLANGGVSFVPSNETMKSDSKLLGASVGMLWIDVEGTQVCLIPAFFLFLCICTQLLFSIGLQVHQIILILLLI